MSDPMHCIVRYYVSI